MHALLTPRFTTTLLCILSWNPDPVAIGHNWGLGHFYKFYNSAPKGFSSNCLSPAFAFVQQTWYSMSSCPKSVILVSFLIVSHGSWDSLSHSVTRSWFCWQIMGMKPLDSEDHFTFGAGRSKVKPTRVTLKVLCNEDSTSSGISIRSVFIHDF